MEESYKKLQKEGQNCVDNLVQWMKDSHIIEESQEAQEKAKALFSKIKDKQNVEFEKFKEVVDKLAAENQKTFDEYTKKLIDAIPKLHEALKAAAAAFQETLAKK